MFGGGGIDTLSYVASAQAVEVRLQVGEAAGGHAAGDTFHSIERVIGSAHDDILVGGTNQDWLKGGAGDDELLGGYGDDVLVYTSGLDTFFGEAGTDTADFSDFGRAVWIHLDYAGVYDAYTRDTEDLPAGPWRKIAALDSVENLIGTKFADELRSEENANRLEGGQGNDRLEGAGGDDICHVVRYRNIVRRFGDRYG